MDFQKEHGGSAPKAHTREACDERVLTLHALLGCPYCCGDKDFGMCHWLCPNKQDRLGSGSPWYHNDRSGRSECPCGDDCYEDRVYHG